MTGPQPIAWGLFSASTGKLYHLLYQSENSARAAAAHFSNRWRKFVAVPLFLYTDTAQGAAEMAEVL